MAILIGAAVVTLLGVGVVNRFVKSPPLCALLGGVLCAGLYYLGSGGRYRAEYLIAAGVWGGFFMWRAKKKATAAAAGPLTPR